jgi:PhoH-like ATPase
MPRKPAAAKKPAIAKIFVLDTNVLMHDPSCLYRFEEHDIFLPIMTLEELDNNKKGMSEIARNARQASRTLDEMLAHDGVDIDEGIDLYGPSSKLASGRLFLQTEAISAELPQGLPTSKVDNQILSVVIHLQKKFPKRPVILVSKDINMRIKSRALNLLAEDYFNDKVLEDTDILYTGTRALPANFWEKHGKGMESWKKDTRTYYKVTGPLCPQLLVNEFVWLESDGFAAIVKEAAGKSAVLETLIDYTHPKNAVWGITARNREQNFAMNLLMNPEIDFVTLLGQAGTGKTLLTLGRRPQPDPREQALRRDHHDPRHGTGRRGHRIPAWHRGRKDGAVDGRARGQPRRPHPYRRQRQAPTAATGARRRPTTSSARGSR